LALPVFLARCPCSWTRLLERSSPGVQSLFTVLFDISAPALRELLSWGFFPLQRIRHRRSTAIAVTHFGFPSPSGWDCIDSSHAIDYGAAHRLFQPLSGFLSPLPFHHFQMDNALGVSPFRVFFSHAAPYGSSPPACPLDVTPLVYRIRPKRKLPWARAAP